VEQRKMSELAKIHNDTAFYMNIMKTRPPETISNLALLKQVDYLLLKLLKKLGEQFLQNGGFKESMTSMRIDKRKKDG
jgi:four helix bundle suffix protein